ncbi:MAG TPA: SDR family NAD(P)-dependent oxidoreductase [Anaerolineae bacterium]|nr:SDR family NAD(P)-dependent oxidoreductase [Anaerolineae bacterium]HMR66255.1 SDR family NAD(P)-dependent oxidoreductase [Anaerolineae bacterium]
MKRFVDKVAVVTGAAQGIGAAIALRFAQEGASVAVLDRQDPTLSMQACQETGGSALGLVVDVADKRSIQAAVAQILEAWGTIHIWVNNAGIFDNTPLTELSEARWDQVSDINYKSMFLCAQLAAPPMLAQGWGRFINISSMAGKVAFPNEVTYCSTKSAVLGLTRALAMELGPHGITANAICPGPIYTDMLKATHQSLADQHNTTLEAWDAQILATIPVGRFGRPGDIAGLAAFLASDDASFINAQAINIDGGMVFY